MFVPIVASERPLAWISQRASAAPTQQSASPGCGVATFPGEEHGLRNTTRAGLRLLGHSIIVTATGCILALSTAASAANKAPDKIQGDCISSECHSTMGKAAFVHGPAVLNLFSHLRVQSSLSPTLLDDPSAKATFTDPLPCRSMQVSLIVPCQGSHRIVGFLWAKSPS